MVPVVYLGWRPFLGILGIRRVFAGELGAVIFAKYGHLRIFVINARRAYNKTGRAWGVRCMMYNDDLAKDEYNATFLDF